MIAAALVGVAILALYVWQDGIHPCPDGYRYTSGKPQPTPFNRRYCNWNRDVLRTATYAGFIGICMMLGDWQKALLLMTLPGVWLCSTRPDTVDSISMCLSLASALLLPSHPILAILVACAAGAVHERGPVFAAVFCLSPIPLLGLFGNLLVLQRPAPRPVNSPHDADKFVGWNLWESVKAHKSRQDWLSWESLVWPTRCIPLAATLAAVPFSAWLPMGLSFASRAIATDTGRAMLWGGAFLLFKVPADSIPPWLTLLHVVIFRRMV